MICGSVRRPNKRKPASECGRDKRPVSVALGKTRLRLEKLIPREEAGEYAVKKREWEALKKACWAEYRSRERGLGF